MRNTKRVLSMILAVCMLLSVLPLSAFALTITEKPADGTTVGQPFLAGTGGSNNFRIPGIVTLNDGTLIATTDARWNGTADAGGLDTLVSVSKDNGANWTYTFANYLGDNGDTWINTSSCIIDPAIGTDGTTAYMIADLFPAGFAINSAKYYAQDGSTGFNDEGNMILRSDEENGLTFGDSSYASGAASANYGYYLADGKIYTTEGTEVAGYSVDAYFNIVSEDGSVNTNLFFSDSPYKPFPTDYLYMTTSTDGLEWSEPTLLNLKAADEQTLLVGPGNGTYNAVTDHMVFTAYEYDWGTQNTALIWQDTDGQWYRSENVSPNTWTSEATAVVLDDGTVRVFYRDGYSILRYTDMAWDEASHNYVRMEGATEVTTQAAKRYNNQLTSIMYSQQIDGKDVILVACAANPDGRQDGRLYVFLVDTDNSMELAYAYDIVPNKNEGYAYNCITEMSNGDIALLYEGDNPDTNASAEIVFTTIDMDDVVVRDNDARLSFVDVTVLTGDSVTYTDNSGYYPNPDLSELDTNVATVAVTGSEVVTDASRLGNDATYSGDYVDTADSLYTFTYDADTDRWSAASTDADGNAVYLYPGNTTASGYPNRADAYSNLSIFAGSEEGSFSIMSNDCDNASQNTSYLYFDRSGLRWDRVSSPGTNATWLTNTSLYLYRPVDGAGSTEIPGYERVTALAEVTDGEYLIAAPGSDGNIYTLYPSTNTATRYNQIAKVVGRTTVGHTDVTITGVGAGYTEAQVGSTVYRITAKESATVNVTLPVGSSVTYTQDDGNYANADTGALDTSVATVDLEGSDGANEQGVAVTPSTALTDGTYVIYNTRAQKLVNNTSASADAAAGSMAGLALSGNTTSLDATTAVWTIKAVEGGYTVQDPNGKYMTIGANAGGLSDEEQILTIAYANGTWTLMQNNAYLNDAAGAGTTASGWEHSSAATDAGSQFNLYAYGESVPAAGTTVTFTGVYPGTTSLTVDRVTYEITVTGDVIEVALDAGETFSYAVADTDVDMTQPDADVATTAFGTGYGAQLGSAQSTYAGAYVDLSKLLYTFTQNEDGTTWTVSNTDADGNTVYLEPYATTNGNGYPNVTSPVAVTLSTGSADNSVYISGNGGYLHFHRSSKLYFDRVTAISGFEAALSFLLYRPAAADETSSTEIPGYVLVEGVAAVTEGEYLIVAEYNGNYYMLYPTTSNAHRNAQTAHLVSDATAVVLTATGEGETSFRVEDTIIEVTVAHSHSYEAVVTAPTCTAGGYTTHTCSCGDSYVTDETPALGHDFENGVCTVCGKGIAYNVDTDTAYTSLAEALAAAQAGETVKLLGGCTEEKVLVTPNVTLDLNGHELTADYVVGFNCADVVDSVGGGKLIVDEKHIVLDEGNGMVPVYAGDGYIFTKAGFAISKDESYEGKDIKINAVAYPTNMDVVNLLKDGTADNNLQVVIILTWDTEEATGSQKFVFTDEVVAQVYGSNQGNWDQYTKMFSMVISGAESVENLKANIALVSGTNAVYMGTQEENIN